MADLYVRTQFLKCWRFSDEVVFYPGVEDTITFNDRFASGCRFSGRLGLNSYDNGGTPPARPWLDIDNHEHSESK